MQVVVSLLFFASFCWSMYQLKRGEAYAHTGLTIASPIAWISRQDDPNRYWMTVIPQAAAGLLPLIAVAV